MIPLVDLKAQYLSIREEIDAAIAEVVRAAAFIGGPQVAAFEKSFAAFCGARYAVGVASGTDALALALRACGVAEGDEVVTVPNTFIATTEAIALVGARPVFADIDAQTCTMKPEALEAAITPRTRAVVPVHLYGRMADMDPILAIARLHGLRVVEDACQAHGAEYKGRRAGSIGDAAAFSFYPGKNLGAFGDAGAVVTGDAAVARRIRQLGNHGRTAHHEHTIEGTNSRLDTVQAAILGVKLRHLDGWNSARARWTDAYCEELEGVDGLVLPESTNGKGHAHHLFVVRAKRRDELLRHLRAGGIEAGVHYPVPLHQMAAYHHLGWKQGAYPAAEAACREVISLPLYPEMDRSVVHRVATRVRAFYTRAVEGAMA